MQLTSVDEWYNTLIIFLEDNLTTLDTTLRDFTEAIVDPEMKMKVRSCFQNSFDSSD